MVLAETFKALGDPVRIEILKRLSGGMHYTVGNLSSGLGLTRQGARKHLQVLVEAELVSLKPSGRETVVKLDASSLVIAKSFIADLELRWDNRLQALRNFVEDDDLTK
jgi:DNA-binding transcriptional ArsR family regulator